MGHNYAKPLSAEQRLTRLLSRIPGDWNIAIERRSGNGWRAKIHAPDMETAWSADHPELVDAVEESWRQNRRPAA